LANIVLAEKKPTLLAYNTLDPSLFTLTGITPTNKFFFRPNISDSAYPDIMIEQNAIIKNRGVMFVVTETRQNPDGSIDPVNPVLSENYECVARVYSGSDATLLYKIRNHRQ
jgi:hypothetical protein